MNGNGDKIAWGAVPLIAAFAICAATALWISQGVALWSGDTRGPWHHYEYLAEGFAHGHTHLSVDPDPELLALRDPYDPAANVGHKLWDASLYRGRYYLYFGPAPALLMLPWRIVTGQEPPQHIAVAAAAVAELAALALLLRELRRRHFPRLSPVGLAAILFVAFYASWLPVILRRSAFWELPITGALACLAWAVYFLWRFHASGGKARWALAGGSALALLIGCRATYVFSAGAVALLFLVPAGGGGPARKRIPSTAILAGLFAFAGGVALLLYNHERFGKWLEFGLSYQLYGKEYRGLHFFSARFVPYNIRAYLFSLPEFGPYFPFVHPFSPERAPAEYMETEDMFGVLFMMPVQLAGLAGCAWAWRNRAQPARRAAVLAVAAAAVTSVLSAVVLFSFGFSASRYTAELVGGWTIVACVGLMSIYGSDEVPRPSRLVRTCAGLAACWTVIGVGLSSAEYREYMRQTNPRIYGALAHALDQPADWWARRQGLRFGAVDLGVKPSSNPVGSRSVLMASGRPEMLNYLMMDQTGDGECRFILAWNEHHVLETPPVRVQGGSMHLRVEAPWLYPPTDDPYWDRIADPAERGDLQTRFSLAWDTGETRINSPHFSDSVALQPTVLGVSDAPTDSAAVESIRPASPRP
jgi:hypothetical protein